MPRGSRCPSRSLANNRSLRVRLRLAPPLGGTRPTYVGRLAPPLGGTRPTYVGRVPRAFRIDKRADPALDSSTPLAAARAPAQAPVPVQVLAPVRAQESALEQALESVRVRLSHRRGLRRRCRSWSDRRRRRNGRDAAAVRKCHCGRAKE